MELCTHLRTEDLSSQAMSLEISKVGRAAESCYLTVERNPGKRNRLAARKERGLSGRKAYREQLRMAKHQGKGAAV